MHSTSSWTMLTALSLRVMLRASSMQDAYMGAKGNKINLGKLKAHLSAVCYTLSANYGGAKGTGRYTQPSISYEKIARALGSFSGIDAVYSARIGRPNCPIDREFDPGAYASAQRCRCPYIQVGGTQPEDASNCPTVKTGKFPHN